MTLVPWLRISHPAKVNAKFGIGLAPISRTRWRRHHGVCEMGAGESRHANISLNIAPPSANERPTSIEP